MISIKNKEYCLMSWFHYVGSHVHNFCDTDNGYFLEGGKGEHLLPGREIRFPPLYLA